MHPIFSRMILKAPFLSSCNLGCPLVQLPFTILPLAPSIHLIDVPHALSKGAWTLTGDLEELIYGAPATNRLMERDCNCWIGRRFGQRPMGGMGWTDGGLCSVI